MLRLIYNVYTTRGATTFLKIPASEHPETGPAQIFSFDSTWQAVVRSRANEVGTRRSYLYLPADMHTEAYVAYYVLKIFDPQYFYKCYNPKTKTNQLVSQ